MEENLIMYTTELIRKFPRSPQQPILFIVYNEAMVKEATQLIATIHGREYLFDHVTIASFEEPFDRRGVNYSVYIDPMVFKYKNSWND